jgi:hypothetical protein
MNHGQDRAADDPASLRIAVQQPEEQGVSRIAADTPDGGRLHRSFYHGARIFEYHNENDQSASLHNAVLENSAGSIGTVVSACRAVVGHKYRIADEHGIADLV